MEPPRRQFLHLVGIAAAMPAVSRIARAQTYPARPIHWIVSFTAGGPNDTVARIIGQYLAERLGQQFIIENKVGAGGNIGMAAVLSSPPDGYTIGFVAPNNAINATLYDKLPFDFARDSAPVAGTMLLTNVMGASGRAGQDRRRVHRLRQGQSGQDQHGIVGQRHVGAPVGRVVQGDDGHHHAARALPRLVRCSGARLKTTEKQGLDLLSRN